MKPREREPVSQGSQSSRRDQTLKLLIQPLLFPYTTPKPAPAHWDPH